MNYWFASKKAFAIEDGFANMIGEEAVKELKKVKEMEYEHFNEDGSLSS